MCLLRHDLGESVWKDYIQAYREYARRVCPIYEIPCDADGAYNALYYKGAVLLYDLESRVGKKTFFSFMQGLAARHVATNECFLQIARAHLGQNDVEWLVKRLKE
ncbi:MAG: hypothetical protein WCS17_09380 [Prevotella sp.]